MSIKGVPRVMPSRQLSAIEHRLRIVRAIVYTEDRPFDCDDTFQLLSQYIDLELVGADVSAEVPSLAAHLIRCRHCEDVHEALLEIARLERTGQLPDLSHLWDELFRLVVGPDQA